MSITGPPPDRLRQFIDDTLTNIAELEQLQPDPRVVASLELFRFELSRLERLLAEPAPGG